jgi:hypothetical protein
MSDPTLTATIDDGKVNITVEDGDDTYEDLTVDVGMALQNQKGVTMFERPILTLLTLHGQTGDEAPAAAETDAGGEPVAMD